MTVRTRAQIDADIAGVRGETVRGANNTARIANLHQDILDSAPLFAELSGHLVPTRYGFGAGVDCSAAIQSGLADGPVVIPPGTWRCDTMIEVGPNQSLTLAPGATLIRQSAHSASTDPVVWINGAQASVVGGGCASSAIVSENRSPSGVVRLGFADMTGHVPDRSIYRCTLKSLKIQGKDYQGGGFDDCVLYMPSAQNDSDPNPRINYFHVIKDLALLNGNRGLHLHGWSNGNFIVNVQGAGIGEQCIYLNGALDNIIQGCFFDSSPDSAILYFEDFTNSRGTYVSSYNALSAIGGEQGGTDGATIRTGATFTGNGNVVHCMVNTNQGNPVSANFYDSNTVIWGGGLDTSNVRAHGTSRFQTIYRGTEYVNRADGTPFVSAGAFGRVNHWICTGLTENTHKSIAQVEVTDAVQGGLIEIRGWGQGGSGIQNAAYYGLWAIEKYAVGTAPVITNLVPGTGFVRPVLTDATHIDFVVAVPNNGNDPAQSTTGYFEANVRGVTLSEDSHWTFRASGTTVSTGLVPARKNIDADFYLASGVDTTLSTDASTVTLICAIPGLLPSTNYTCTVGIRTTIWKSSDLTVCGEIDETVGLYILTDGSGVATSVTVLGTQYADVTRLPAGLFGATGKITATASGFQVEATRPAGVACKARSKAWINRIEVIS